MSNPQSKPQSIFITATDTDAGKTYVSDKLIRLLVKNNRTVAAFKPISAGCCWRDGEWQNEDALCLKAAANAGQTLSQINPIAFEPPIAPHIAAAQQGVCLSVATVAKNFHDLTPHNADICIVEGAGGWRLPLNDSEFLSEFVVQERMPVILVVGMKLGCLNHAILTYQTLMNDGVKVIGWVANQAQPEKMSNHAENVAFLKAAINAPCLGELAYSDDENALHQALVFNTLKAKDN
ncbi:dethiobiotin synthase [Thalassotalea litorea]|uniref:dethiobiotin synthase n=1 Tax=Thalassotalea litorea TaxID=2020715 RepID=UPI003736D73B